MEQERAPHIAMLPSPGMGHLIPLAELAKILVDRHNFTVTIITFSDFSSSASQHAYLDSLPSKISSICIPPIPLPDLSSEASIETRVFSLIAHAASFHLPKILETLQNTCNLVAYVIDLFGGDTLHVAKQLQIPQYMFFTSNLFMLSFMFHLPELHRTTSCEYRDLPNPVSLPGCIPLRGEDFLEPLGDRSGPACAGLVRMAESYRLLDGILVNSFDAMEPETTRCLGLKEEGRPPVYPVGPVIRPGSVNEFDKSECIKWLDEQPNESVLFICFGSGGNLSSQQMRELAFGLEMSGKRFLWVVRTPSDFGVKGGSVWMGKMDENPLDFLPDGFTSRTERLGMVVSNWAPQIEVLSHVAVGGFMSHCGWNSTLESVMNGVPMIVWPLYAEQRMNAVMLTEGAKIALRPKGRKDEIVEKEEIGRVVRDLMEGEGGHGVRKRVQELQKACVQAWGEEGSSTKKLVEVAKRWKTNIEN